jgi:hypothetical protein
MQHPASSFGQIASSANSVVALHASSPRDTCVGPVHVPQQFSCFLKKRSPSEVFTLLAGQVKRYIDSSALVAGDDHG